MAADTDPVLYARAREGDPAAAARLFDRHCPKLLRQLRSRFDRELAEDAAQEAWLLAFKGRAPWRGSGSFSTWLLTVSLRKAARLQSIAEHCAELFPHRSPTRATRRILVQQVIAALERLDNPQQRLAAQLHWLEQLPSSEIAARLGIPVRTVQSRIRLARVKLERALVQATQSPSTAR